MRKRIAAVLIVLIGGVAICVFWPAPACNLANIDARLRSLKRPCRAGEVSYYLDGGSLGFHLIGQDGAALKLALPIDGNYEQLFLGATHTNKQQVTPLEFNPDTKLFLEDVLEHDAPPGRGRDLGLVKLRGKMRDKWRLLVHAGWFRLSGRYPGSDSDPFSVR